MYKQQDSPAPELFPKRGGTLLHLLLQRKTLAEQKRAAEEAELAAKLAYEARSEANKEEAERKAAKEALKAFLLK